MFIKHYNILSCIFYFPSELGLETGTILTQHEKREEKTKDYALKITPVWEWLLM